MKSRRIMVKILSFIMIFVISVVGVSSVGEHSVYAASLSRDAKKAYKPVLADGTFLSIFDMYDSERIEEYCFLCMI